MSRCHIHVQQHSLLRPLFLDTAVLAHALLHLVMFLSGNGQGAGVQVPGWHAQAT